MSAVFLVASFLVAAPVARAQSPLDSLVALALATSPSIKAASLRVEAARARISPAGVRPDPMLMGGIQNLPLGREAGMSGSDPMTMRMLGISQAIPLPGKLSSRTAIAEREAAVALAALNAERVDVVHRVRAAYYELAYVDQALRIVEQSHAVLSDIIRVTEAHYSVGTGTQQDVLKARVEAAQLGYEASALREQRRAQVASLNALLSRPSDSPIESAPIPAEIIRAAIADSTATIRFASDVLGAAVTGSRLPPLATLQDIAVANNPMLMQHEAAMAVQEARVALAEKETRPDLDLSLQYGQRPGRPDMLTALVSLPIPIHKRINQNAGIIAARFELAALEAEHLAQVNELRAQVAKLYSDIERQRTQLALDVKAIIPQGRAVLSAAASNYQAGKSDLLTLLDSRSTLFAYETSYYRLLSDFAESVADLDQLVGKEVLP